MLMSVEFSIACVCVCTHKYSCRKGVFASILIILMSPLQSLGMVSLRKTLGPHCYGSLLKISLRKMRVSLMAS